MSRKLAQWISKEERSKMEYRRSWVCPNCKSPNTPDDGGFCDECGFDIVRYNAHKKAHKR